MANAKQDRARKTRREQREALERGTLHPRGLARSVAKTLGKGQIPEDWRDVVAKLPRTGRKYLKPENEIAARMRRDRKTKEAV